MNRYDKLLKLAGLSQRKRRWIGMMTVIAANFNNRALNALFCEVINEEFKKISSTEVAKEAWTILETTCKGSKVVMILKFQRLTSSFEEIKMEENETFDEFYAKLKDIVNFAFNLGESITESKLLEKSLGPYLKDSMPRSLPLKKQRTLIKFL